MDPPDLDNDTELAVHPQVLLDRDGERLVTIVKATFELEEDGLELAPDARRRGIRFADVPWEEKKPASIAYPGDLCIRKPGTDVVFIASAHAPGGRPARRIDVRVEVGSLRRSLVVHGPRVWLDGGVGLGPAGEIGKLDLRWDHAWGGLDDGDPEAVLEEPRNPIGTGLIRDHKKLTGAAAPSIEDPEQPIRTADTRPPPAGIGPIGRHFAPRRDFAGTYSAAWLESRAPLPPDDFDDRHNRCAAPGLTSETPLTGGEAIRLLNLIPGGGPLEMVLPRMAIEIVFDVRGRPTEAVRPHLDTVVIDLLEVGPDKPIAVEMAWRASVRAPRKLRDARITVREVSR